MLIGHQKQWQFLKRSVELEKISHAYLFYGQEKLGKKTLALEFIKLINCQNKDKLQEPCRVCYSCQSIEKLQHPDILLIKPPDQYIGEGDKPSGKDIQISQIRELTDRLSLRPFLALFKAVILDQAHLMNQQAQGALLKTLEEPKGNSILILITEYPEMLFPTILSRAQKIKFYPIKRKEIEDYLLQRGCSQEKVKFISPISFGRPGIAIDFLLNSEKLATEEQKLTDLIKITASDFASRFQYAKKITQKTQNSSQVPREILESWLRYFRELLLCKAGVISNNGAYPELQKIFKRYSLSKLKEIIKILQNTIFFLSTTNVNPKLALEILMLEL